MDRRSVLAAALLCAVFAAPAGATEYDWVPAGHIGQPRIGAASTVLSDGRVLIAGGWHQQDVVAVDIYDPGTQTWSAGPPLPEPRRRASAVTLRDGRVLVVGGEDLADDRTAEIFDPATGGWTPAASSLAPHSVADGFVLGDGRVLFLGGTYYGSLRGEIYDPATDSWRLTAASHEVGGAGPAVVRLQDGRFLVVGVKTVFAQPSSYDEPRAEIYDVGRDTWSVVAPPRYAGEGSGAALLPDGRVLVAGGRPGGAPGQLLDVTAHRHSEIFDPAMGGWSPTGELNEPRASGSTFVVLGGGSVAAIGGSWATIVGPFGSRYSGQIFYQATSEVYDVASGTWRLMPSMADARSGHVAALLADGSVLVATGSSGSDGSGTWAAERLVPRPAPPATPPPPVVAPSSPVVAPSTRPKAGRLRFVKVPKRAKLTRAGRLWLRLRCSSDGAGCADRLVLRGRGRVLARRHVTVRAGKTVRVRVKPARRALRHRTTRVTLRLQRQGTKRRIVVRG